MHAPGLVPVRGRFLPLPGPRVHLRTQHEVRDTPIPLLARIEVLPVRGGERFLRNVFEPLGYVVEATRCPLDERFPDCRCEGKGSGYIS